MLRRVIQRSVNAIPWSWRSRVKDVPLVAPLQRWVLQQFLHDREFLHTINAGPAKGLHYPVRLPADKAIWTGTYEPEFSAALVGCLAPGMVCFDIGGYRGFFSGLFAIRGARQVVTFEPLPDNVRQIRAVIAANPELPITIHEVALGADKGTATFRVMPEASMGKLTDSPFQSEARGDNAITVRVEALDDLVAAGAVPEPDFVKIDVEGAEAMVLDGAEKTFARRLPILFMEIHTRELARRCFEKLQAIGYAVSVIETAAEPDFRTEPEVCHFAAHAAAGKGA